MESTRSGILVNPNPSQIIIGSMTRKKWAKKYVECNYNVARETCKPPYTYVALTVNWDGKTIFGEGFAKCSPRDKWSSLGLTIARGRAIADLAKQLDGLAFGSDELALTPNDNSIRLGRV